MSTNDAADVAMVPSLRERQEAIVDFALKAWCNCRLALALLHVASLPVAQQEFTTGWKTHLVELLATTGWRDAGDGHVIAFQRSEASCVAAFMEILMGQADPSAPYLHDIESMGAHVQPLTGAPDWPPDDPPWRRGVRDRAGARS